MLRPSAELALLEAVSVIAAQSKHLVTYNGKSFDLPLLRTRYRLAGLTDPFASHGHLDLVHWVRRMRPTQWPDARLGTIESRQFGLTRHQDLPGEAIPIAWQQWLRDGNATDLRRVPAHNRLDLLSLYGTLQIALMNRETDLFRPAGGATQGYREKTPLLQADPRARLDNIHSILRAAGASREAKLV